MINRLKPYQKGLLVIIVMIIALAVAINSLQTSGGPNPIHDPMAWVRWVNVSPVSALVTLIATIMAGISAWGVLNGFFKPAAATSDDIKRLEALIVQMGAAQGRTIDAETQARAGAALTAVARSDAPDLAAARQAIRDGDPEGVVDALIASTSGDAAERLREAGDIAFAFDVKKALTAYGRAAALEPQHVWTHIQLSRLHRLAGDLPRARAAAQAALDHARDERDWSLALNELGDVARAEGDLPGARRAYEAGLDIRQRLSAQDRTNTQWLRDLSVSHDRLGDVAEGDLSGARRAYEAGLEIAQRLSDQDRTNTAWLRDLAVSYAKLAQVSEATSDRSSAREGFREAERIFRRILALSPTHAETRRMAELAAANAARLAE